MGRGTETKLWCIKLSSNAAFLFKGGKRIPNFQNIVGAVAIDAPATSTWCEGSSPNPKKLLKMEFIPTQSGSYRYATLNPRHFNPFDCDGDFKNIGSSRDADSLANKICSQLEGLKQLATTENTVEDRNKAPEKRKLTPLYASVQPTKKQKVVEQSSCVKGIMERCNECQFDNKTYFIPVKCLVMPPKERQIRTVDDGFLKDLIKSMEELPSGNYEALFVLVKGIKNREEFNPEKVEQHEYEVLGGTHVMLATKQLNEMYPHNQSFQGRVARIYIGLSDQEALWLGAMHNNTGAFRHQLTYRDEVEISRTQLFLPVQDCSGEPPQPSDSWRDMCASLLHKKKRILSEVFAMAQLSAEGWKHFKTLNTMFESVQLKGQKPKATDIVNKGKPILKQWQLKPLCGLSNHDQNFLLEKVTSSDMSLEEMKKAASEIKLLRPIQEAIVSFFKAETWEEIADEFGHEVLPEKLLRFAVKDFEQSHDFQTYLERLKQQKDTDEIQEVDGVLDGRHGAKGIIIFSSDLNRVQQVSIAKLPNFRGAFLAVGDTYDDCESALNMISLISRLNFTKTTSFNLVLFVNVDDVKTVKERMKEGGAVDTQTAHFYVTNVNHRRERTGPYLTESVRTFLIGHWSVSRQVTTRHLRASNMDNLISLDGKQNKILPEDAFSWLVEHMSCEGDTVIDIDSDKASTFIAALKEGRNAVWITSQSCDVQQRLRLETVFAQNPDSESE